MEAVIEMTYAGNYLVFTSFPILICWFKWLSETHFALLKNPIFIPTFFFWVPSFLALLKISPYQTSFSKEIVFIMGISSVCLIVFPTLLLSIDKPMGNLVRRKRYNNEVLIKRSYYIFLFIITSIYIILWLLENKLTYNSFLPILRSFITVSSIDHYSSSTSFFNWLLPIMKWLVPFLLLDIFIRDHKNSTLFVFVISISIPFSRGQRSTFLLFGILLMSCAFDIILNNIKKSPRKFMIIIIIIISLLLIFYIVQEVRTVNYNYGYWIGLESKNLLESTFNWYYGYTSMSFDTLQRSYLYWQSLGAPKFWGLGMIAGFSNLTKLHYIMNFEKIPYQKIMDIRVYLNGAVVLPTGLHQLLLDFGFLGCFIFIVFLSFINYFTYRLFLINSLYFPMFGIALIFTFSLVTYSAFLMHQAIALVIISIIMVRKRQINKLKKQTT